MVDMIYTPLIITVITDKRRRISWKTNKKNLLQLAWNLLFKICANLILFLRNIIQSEDFISHYRQCKPQFTRTRKLPFHIVILFLLSLLRGSYQNELDRFFKALLRFDVAKRIVTKAALCKARMKLKYQAFIELNFRLIQFFMQHFCLKTWMGFRLVAIDGSTIRLPRTADIEKHFGQWKVRQGRPSPMARLSQLYDTLNHITIDAIISPKRIGERELAAQHIRHILPTDLILMDRGYPAWWLFALIISMCANFCARISSKWTIVQSFLQSGAKESIIYLPLTFTSMKQAHKLNLALTPLKLRLLRFEMDGKIQVLITSLIDTKMYPYEIFVDLYHKRWPVEEDYKIIKSRIELENFSGQSALSVYQDFHAKVFLKNLVSVLSSPINDALADITTEQVLDYKINFTQAISKTRDVLILLFNFSKSKLYQLIRDLQEVFMKTIEPIRPGRKYPRRRMASSRRHFLCYKPIS